MLNILEKQQERKDLNMEIIQNLVDDFTNTAGYCNIYIKNDALYISDGGDAVWYCFDFVNDYYEDVEAEELIKDLIDDLDAYEFDEAFSYIWDYGNKTASILAHDLIDIEKTMENFVNYLIDKRSNMIDKIGELRQEAIEWQGNWENERNLIEFSNKVYYFEEEAEKLSYDLLDEFRENGIC